MMRSVLLIDPPFPERPWDINWLTLFPPKGLLYIASALKKADIKVEVIDTKIMQYERPSLLRRSLGEISCVIEEKVKGKDYQLIGFTSSTLSFKPAVELAKVAKKASPKSTVMIGGVHSSFVSDDILKGFTWIDIVVRGEGEITAVELAEGRPWEQISGISFSKNGEVVHNPDRHFLPPEQIPIPAYDCVDMRKYSYVVLQCVRGCPKKCSYCEIPFLMGVKPRPRLSKDILAELDLAFSLNPNLEIRLEDEFLGLDMKRAREILRGIKQKRLTQFRTAIRPDYVNDELLVLLKEAGCSNLYVGIESGSDEILKLNHRGLSAQSIRGFIDTCKRNKMPFHGGFILGLPGETEDTIKESLLVADACAEATFSIVKSSLSALLQQMPFALIVENSRPEFNLLAPNPGTPIARDKELFRYKIFHNNWEEYDCNTPVGEPCGLDAKRLVELKQYALKRVKDKMKDMGLPVGWWDQGYKG